MNASPLATAAAVRPRVGLVAAWGDFPLQVARALHAQQVDVYCLGVAEHADRAALAPYVADFRWIGLGRLGGAIRYFRRHGVTQATMAGKFHKKILYRPWIWIRHVPDWTALRWFYPHFVSTRRDRKDDTLLGRLVEAFAAHGVVFGPATDYAPELLVKFGQLSRRPPSAAEVKDIEFGWTLAREMGRLDVGQSVMVKDRAVLAIEAIEGTDECIQRAGALCAKGGFTIVKVAKPQQDMRFDVPTIGLRTLRIMQESGARVLAIEAHKTIVVDDYDELRRYADQHGLTILSVEEAPADAANYRMDAAVPLPAIKLRLPDGQMAPNDV